tara:strand:- start:3924 stop:4730 length:807 start_codon:yes stop_codon:yes gene_type:complete
MKRVAICMRGICKNTNINNKTGKIESIDYALCIKSIFNNIINCNNNYTFDFYLHGWIGNDEDIKNIINDYNPKKYILEKQINFQKEFENISNKDSIVKERYKHIKNKKELNINLYFQTIYSYAYSISKSVELLDNNIEYEYIISLRYDCNINKQINLARLENSNIYTDYTGGHSPLFFGDFIFISSKENMMHFKDFYKFLKTKIYHNIDYKNWTKNIILNRKKTTTGRYEHGIYSNQMIIAYYIQQFNNVKYSNVISYVNCNLNKTIQ